MNRKIILIICAFLILNIANSAFACSCIGVDSVKIAFKKSDVVIVGEAINIEDIVVPFTLPGKKTVINRYYKKVTFKVSTIYKGKVKTDNFEIITKIGSGDCGFPFKIGVSYVIYGTYKKKYFESEEEVPRYLYTDICTRTTSNYVQESSEIKRVIRRCRNK